MGACCGCICQCSEGFNSPTKEFYLLNIECRTSWFVTTKDSVSIMADGLGRYVIERENQKKHKVATKSMVYFENMYKFHKDYLFLEDKDLFSSFAVQMIVTYRDVEALQFLQKYGLTFEIVETLLSFSSDWDWLMQQFNIVQFSPAWSRVQYRKACCGIIDGNPSVWDEKICLNLIENNNASALLRVLNRQSNPKITNEMMYKALAHAATHSLHISVLLTQTYKPNTDKLAQVISETISANDKKQYIHDKEMKTHSSGSSSSSSSHACCAGGSNKSLLYKYEQWLCGLHHMNINLVHTEDEKDTCLERKEKGVIDKGGYISIPCLLSGTCDDDEEKDEKIIEMQSLHHEKND